MFCQQEKKRQPSSGWRRNSEGIFQAKTSVSKDQKKELTGYVSYREERKRVKESLRFENSYGTVAFGGDERGGMMILASEKRRHNSQGITEKEKTLWESRQTERPMGQGKVIANAGGLNEGAFAFQHQPGDSRFEMMRRMKQYTSAHEQETVHRMMPFLSDKEDLDRKRRLEEAARTMRERGKGFWAGELNMARENEEQLLQQNRQMESLFNQKLVQAMNDVKMETPEISRSPFLMSQLMSILVNALLDQQDKKEDEKKDEAKTDENNGVSDSESEKKSKK